MIQFTSSAQLSDLFSSKLILKRQQELMETVPQLQRKLVEYRTSLFNEVCLYIQCQLSNIYSSMINKSSFFLLFLFLCFSAVVFGFLCFLLWLMSLWCFSFFLFFFFEQGILDDQFTQLQELQDENNPDFVVEVVTLFFQDTERLLNELARTL